MCNKKGFRYKYYGLHLILCTNLYCDILVGRFSNELNLFQLVAVLREVKYLEIRASEEIPGSAADIYSKNDTFRQYVANLDLTVQWYNKVCDLLRDLFADEVHFCLLKVNFVVLPVKNRPNVP